MTGSANKLIPADFATLPGYDALRALTILASDPPPDSEAIGYTVYAEGPVPAELGLDRDALTRAGFEPKVGHTLVIPTLLRPDLIAVGADSPTELDTTRLRDLAAAFTRAAARRSRLALVIGAVDAGPEDAARALTEGAALARYRYTPLKSASKHTLLRQLALHVAGVDPGAVIRGSSAGLIEARATIIAATWRTHPQGISPRPTWAKSPSNSEPGSDSRSNCSTSKPSSVSGVEASWA